MKLGKNALKWQRYGGKLLRACLMFLVCWTAPHSFGANITMEGVWWRDLRVAVTPRMAAENTIYAIDVVLTNRSMVDVARLRKAVYDEPLFFLAASGPTWNAKSWGKERKPILQPVIPYTGQPPERAKEAKAIEILPGKNVSYCLSMKSLLLPTVSTQWKKDDTLHIDFDIFADLSWKRQTGHVTLWGWENKRAQNSGAAAARPPPISLGEYKIDPTLSRECN